jgi:hypothetical protein
VDVSDVRPSPISGQWYADQPEVLSRAVDDFIRSAALPPLEGEVVAVIAPHAGHRYSGAVAGYAFASLLNMQYELVAVVSPMHHPSAATLLTTAHRAYETPLGEVQVDEQAVLALDSALQLRLGSGLSQVAYDPEHSLEIELPFLQRALRPGWRLVPVMVRALDERTSEQLGSSLAEVLRGRRSVLVGSTDLSHFYDQRTAEELDATMLSSIEAFSPEAVFETERSGRGFACGLGALTAVLWAARTLGANKMRILKHATSADVTGDPTSVVGYGAAVALRIAS